MASRAHNITQPDFAIFGLRWLIPLAVLVDGLGKSAAGDPEAFAPAAVAIIFGSAAYNLGVLMALNTAQWRLAIAMVTVTIDALLSIAIVALVGPSLVWVALLPIVVAGGRFGWLSGLILAGMLVFGAFGMTIIMQGNQSSTDTLLQLGMAAVLLPLTALASGVVSQSQLHSSAVGRSERLDRQLRAAREQIRVIYEMAATLSTSLNYSRVLDMVLEVSVHGLERLGVSSRISAAVLLFSPENGRMVLRVAAHRRITPADARAMVPGLEGAIGRALKQAEPVTTYNPHDDPELKYFAGFRESEAVLCVPMFWQGQVIGVVNVLADQEERAFTSENCELLIAFAGHAAIAVENARLLEAERRRREEAETLREVANAINSSLEMDRVLDLILEQLARVVSYDSASIMYVSDGALGIVAQRGFHSEEQQFARLDIDTLLHIREVFDSLQPVIIEDTTADPRWIPISGGEYIRCWMGIPLNVMGRVIGILNVDSVHPGYYTDADARSAVVFADQAAFAFEKVRLYTKAQQQAKEAETLRKAGATVVSTLRLDEAIDRILKQLELVVPYDSAYNFLWFRFPQIIILTISTNRNKIRFNLFNPIY